MTSYYQSNIIYKNPLMSQILFLYRFEKKRFSNFRFLGLTPDITVRSFRQICLCSFTKGKSYVTGGSNASLTVYKCSKAFNDVDIMFKYSL